MRIIITKNGEYIIKEFEEDNSVFINDIKLKNAGLTYSPRLPKISNIKTIKEKLLSPSKTTYPFSKLKILKKKKSLSMMNNYFNRDESKINKKELEQAKKIVVSKSKVQMSQKFLEKYHNLDSSFKEKLDNLSNLLNSHKDKDNNKEDDSFLNMSPYKFKMKQNNYGETGSLLNKTLSSFRKNKKIKIGDIISHPNLIQLKSYITKSNMGNDDVRIPLDKNNKNSFNFRTRYENKKVIKENLDNILNVSINSDRKNLINYLKRNKSIAPYYFKNLLKCDELQIYKLNKMCGIIMNKENKNISEGKNRKNIKNKILDNSSKGLISLLDKTNRILNNYSEYKEYQIKFKKN